MAQAKVQSKPTHKSTHVGIILVRLLQRKGSSEEGKKAIIGFNLRYHCVHRLLKSPQAKKREDRKRNNTVPPKEDALIRNAWTGFATDMYTRAKCCCCCGCSCLFSTGERCPKETCVDRGWYWVRSLIGGCEEEDRAIVQSSLKVKRWRWRLVGYLKLEELKKKTCVCEFLDNFE